ncbi:MAG: P63C domain-containing protein [Ottowia sp.]|nr:P63C domain-containing protein [Ottowia sp.]
MQALSERSLVMDEEKKELTGRAKGGAVVAAKMTPEQKAERARKGAQARWGEKVLKATHGSADHPLRIGDLEIPCYVLEDGRRVLSLGGMVKAMGMTIGSAGGGEGDRLTSFASGKAISPFISNDLASRMKSPVRFNAPTGGTPATGYEATILADLCDAVLAARKAGALRPQQEHIAHQCEILVRGFARVGIIALVDEATGYQSERAKNALATILEAFIAKELQPWIQTFPTDYYRELFRLRGLSFPTASVKRPQYFGVLTNDIVYKRLAPGVLEELRRVTPRNDDGRPKAKYFQSLTSNTGYPKLREHLGKVVMLMQLSKDYNEFKQRLEQYLPVYSPQLTLALDAPQQDMDDEGSGL